MVSAKSFLSRENSQVCCSNSRMHSGQKAMNSDFHCAGQESMPSGKISADTMADYIALIHRILKIFNSEQAVHFV